MVVHLRFADYSFVHRDRLADPYVAVEFTSSRDFRVQVDNILAVYGFADSLENIVRRNPQETEAFLRPPAALGPLEEVA